jgi:SurA N-terminal domain
MCWKGSSVSRRALFTKRRRRVAVLGAAGLGACAVLAACSPVQVGSAAIVGDQRITVSSLDTQVSNLKTAAKPFSGTMQLTAANYPAAVLSWLIRFEVMDQVAASNGINVTSAQSQAALSSLSSLAAQNGTSTSQLLIENGVPPQLFPQVGRWDAQETAYGLKVNGGKAPSSTAEQTTVTDAVNKAQCTAAKSLNIQVSPQFGRLDYTQFSVVPAADTLSKPAGTPTPASTEGLTPAC